MRYQGLRKNEEEGIAFVCNMKYWHNQGKYFPVANYDLSEDKTRYDVTSYSSGALPGTLFTKLSTATTL